MLHPLRLEQKNPNEEDSSDSGSELGLGLEPETDRFGFLLTDGSTDGVRQGPSPALVRQREAKWINIIEQWDQLLHKKASKVKMQCQKGIPASLRAKCWPLLSGATDRIKQQTDLYKLLDSQPALKHWEDVIERDLDRQFPFHEMFVSKDGHGQRSLFQVLKAYTQFKPEDGYCQAQGPVAAVLLMNMPAEEAFWCLVQICEQYLPGYYNPLLEGVLFDAAILTWVLKRSCPAAHKHLQRHGVEPLMFATDWLMCMFTRHLPFNTLLRVWDLFFCYDLEGYGTKNSSGRPKRISPALSRRVRWAVHQDTGQSSTQMKAITGADIWVKDRPVSWRTANRILQLNAGVRVLLQVAAVMVQRVLGREDQRKQCCGQMETLQTLRGIKTEVKDEEDDFIVEVLSVPLSARDLQRQTEKELQQWQKERPSSTFDPRGRCQGYHMAWVRSRQSNEESERKEREKGNLSTHLFRSASTLSLSMSKWQKGGKANSSERKSNVKVARHLSMGAKEDCRLWANLNDKKIESLQEDDFVLMEKRKQSDLRTQQIELLGESKHEQTEVQDVPQIIVHLQTVQMKEKSHFSADTSKQEENSESKLAAVDDLTAVHLRERQLPPTITNTHVQPNVELMTVNNSYQVKSLKLLATQAARCLEFNSENEKHLQNLGETPGGNNGTDECLGKLSASGECHFSASLTGTEIKKCHTPSDLVLCDLAANTCTIEQVTVDVKQDGCFTNDIQAISPVEEVSDDTIAGQTADSQDSTKTCGQTEDTTYCQETSIVPTDVNVNTEVDASIDNIKQGTPEREKQSSVCQIRKNCGTSEQIEYDLTNTSQQYSFRSSSDFRVRKPSNSRGSRPAHRLSEDLFTTPQLLDQRITNYSSQAENDETTKISNSVEEQKEEPPRRFALFHRVREEKKNKKQRNPKIPVPKIIIQDFSDDRERGQGAEVDKKLTSREKRRQRKEQKRKEIEEKRQRKKEKEGIKKDGQKGISVHAQSGKVTQQLASAASQSTQQTSYAEVYF